MSDIEDIDQPPAPSPPRFVRRVMSAVGLAERPIPGLREAEEAARAARVADEAAAKTACDARHAREEAERALGPAKEQAAALSAANTRQARVRISHVQQLLVEAKALAAADRSIPSVQLHVRARMLLVGGTSSSDEPFSAAAAITSIAALDRVAGSFLNAQQTAGRAMDCLSQVDAEEGLYREADKMECLAWSGLKHRIAVLAGESS